MYLKPIFISGLSCFTQLWLLPLELAPVRRRLKAIQPLKLPARSHKSLWCPCSSLWPSCWHTFTIMQSERQSQPQSICSLSLLFQDVVQSWLQTGGILNLLTILPFKINTSTKKYDRWVFRTICSPILLGECVSLF